MDPLIRVSFMSVRVVLAITVTAGVCLYSFLNYLLQRYVMRLGQGAAILIFGRVICDTSIHIRNLDAHWAPGGIHRLPSPRQNLPLFVAAANAQSCGLSEYHFSQAIRVFRFSEHRQ